MKKLAVCLMILAIISAGAYWLLGEKPIRFSYVTSINTSSAFREEDDTIWLAIYDNPVSYIPPQYFDWLFEHYGATNNIDFDFENYAYVVVFGYELKRLTYSELYTFGRFTGAYKRYYGKVWVSKRCPENQINIYRISKMFIGCDDHDSGNLSRVVFVE